MSVDADNDSQMLSSPSTTPSSSVDPTTPPTGQHPLADSSTSNLSPPDSQHRSSKMANANGKRPLNATDEDNDIEPLSGGPQPGKPRQEYPLQTHASSGYQWRKPEDEPGWSYRNKKAMDEAHRAWESLVHKDAMIRGRYGDPFEVADKEKAMANSLKQK